MEAIVCEIHVRRLSLDEPALLDRARYNLLAVPPSGHPSLR